MWQRILHCERGEVGDPPEPPSAPPTPSIEDWKSGLDESIRSHPSLKDFKTPNDVVKSYVEVQKLIGPEKIIMPSKDADPKEWNERVFDRLGRPKDPKDYLLPTDLQIPKELPISEKLIDGFRKVAHESGVLPKQFQTMYKWFMNEQIAQYNDLITTRKQTADQSRTALRTEWGAAFDQNLGIAEKVLQTYGDQNVIKYVKDNGLSDDTNFVKFLHNIGKNFSEDQLTGKPPSLTMSPEEAKEEIRKIESDVSDKNPLFNANHHEHEAIKNKRDMLYRMAYPNG
jgi:hypothetical protein